MDPAAEPQSPNKEDRDGSMVYSAAGHKEDTNLLNEPERPDLTPR